MEPATAAILGIVLGVIGLKIYQRLKRVGVIRFFENDRPVVTAQSQQPVIDPLGRYDENGHRATRKRPKKKVIKKPKRKPPQRPRQGAGNAQKDKALDHAPLVPGSHPALPRKRETKAEKAARLAASTTTPIEDSVP